MSDKKGDIPVSEALLCDFVALTVKHGPNELAKLNDFVSKHPQQFAKYLETNRAKIHESIMGVLTGVGDSTEQVGG